jgi:HrpA-like RNA helicase
MQDYQLPEMLRVGLEDLVLNILILDLGEPNVFLGKALNPPSKLAMTNSLKLLETLGAIECSWQTKPSDKRKDRVEEETKTCGDLAVSSELTALGFHLATLPVDPRLGKIMIYGSLFGCVDAALTIAASMSARSPFVSPFGKRDLADAARKEFATEGSDHLTILNAFTQWKDLRRAKMGNRAIQSFLSDSYLSSLTLSQMEVLRKQFANLLKGIGFLPDGFSSEKSESAENANSENVGLFKAVLCAGLYPNIIVAPRSLVNTTSSSPPKGAKKAGECAFQSHTKGEVYLHPSTISHSEGHLDSRYCCYHAMVKTSKTYVRDMTTVSPFALLLFGGALEVFHKEGVISVDGWLKFRIAAKPATLIKHLRAQMENLLLRKIVSPQDDVTNSAEGKALIQSISTLFERERTTEQKMPGRSGGEFLRPYEMNDHINDNRESSIKQEQGQRGGRGRDHSNDNRESSIKQEQGQRGGRGRGRGRGGGRDQGSGGRGRGRRGGRS